MSKKKLIIGGVVVIILLLILGISVFSGPSEDAAPKEGIKRKVFVSAEDQSERDALLATLKDLENITLDGQIFDRAAFRGLVDFSVPLLPQPTGRRNPFAPINPFEQFGTDEQSRDATTTSPSATTSPRR